MRTRKKNLPPQSHDSFAGQLPEVTIYTDGGCIDNPGPGGYGAVLLYKNRRKELSGGYRRTTNNRMELLAAIKGLEALKNRCRVTIYSDSQYLVNAIEEGWARRWQSHGWWRNRKERAINPDLWERLLSLMDKHEVRFSWVRGHVGNPENERADELAREAALGKRLDIDEMYERAPSKDPALLFWK
ncbi:MAG: ribonuclease HI [Acidobacteria bacterium]|nr:ribonuclease HI [Acidobacteriota bacterium]